MSNPRRVLLEGNADVELSAKKGNISLKVKVQEIATSDIPALIAHVEAGNTVGITITSLQGELPMKDGEQAEDKTLDSKQWLLDAHADGNHDGQRGFRGDCPMCLDKAAKGDTE